MELIVNKKSAIKFNSFTDLKNSEVTNFGLGEPATVPAGQYGKQVLENIGIWDTVKNKAVLTKDVQTVLTYVETENIEAGIVFSTIPASSDKVKIVASVPGEFHEEIIFSGVVLTNSLHPAEAQDFLKYLLSSEGTQIFRKYGFSIIEQEKEGR